MPGTDKWEVAGVIGTWVAAFFAFVALGIFVGPFLIWRASQTERHQALDLFEKGGADNGGYVPKGIRVSPRIQLLRHVRVLLLKDAPQFPDRRLIGSKRLDLFPQSRPAGFNSVSH